MSIPTTPLGYRKQGILKAVITDYVRTAEPVGSEALAARHAFGVKSATIRSELAELSDLGYLRQPHTSAGRIPSDLGYRFYVDRLMDQVGLPRTEAVHIRSKLAPQANEVDIILGQTCRMLSGLARYTSLATAPAMREAVISYVSVARVARRKLLLVMVLDNGRVVHELLEPKAGAEALDPVKSSNFLTQRLGGRTLQSAAIDEADASPGESPDMRGLLAKALRLISRELELVEKTGIHLEGASYIMQQPEFKDVERLEAVLSVLEERSALYKLFSAVYLGPEVTVIIGSENPLSEMHNCSFVGAKYYICGRLAGTIGVVGPTRMDYRRAVSAVQFMAANLGDLLSELSVA